MPTVTRAPDGEEYITFADAADEMAYTREVFRFVGEQVGRAILAELDPLIKEAAALAADYARKQIRRSPHRSKFHRKRPRF